MNRNLLILWRGELFRGKPHFVTTLPVVCEIHAHFSRSPLIRNTVLQELCENPLVTIEAVSHHDQRAALTILQTHRDKEYSLSDALSFVIMRRLNIRRAMSFDKHFRQFGGFEVIPEKFP
jgi:uncharacterized protein